MTIPTTAQLAAADAAVSAYQQGYSMGREAGIAEANVQIECLELLVDHWYYVANNPTAVAEERKRDLSYIELREARAERQAKHREWDENEQQMFDQARTMIDQGHSDRTIAVTLGLFLPLVANLRSGAL
jgi:hypothetical protein